MWGFEFELCHTPKEYFQGTTKQTVPPIVLSCTGLNNKLDILAEFCVSVWQSYAWLEVHNLQLSFAQADFTDFIEGQE